MPENIACNLCNSKNFKTNTELKRFLNLPNEYNIVTCRECNLTFINPRPTVEEYKNYYDSPGGYDVSAYIERVTQRLGSYKSRMEEIEKQYGKKGKLLEIGCAAGQFLNIAKDMGWSVQ